MRVALLVVVAIAAAGCHYHRDLNAPMVVDPVVPPKDVTDPQMEYPEDPGEKMVMLTTGVLGGAFGGSLGPSAVVDLAVEATVSIGENPTSHNDQASRLFMPRGVLMPPSSKGLTLGWSGMRVLTREGGPTTLETGPIYVELQRAWLFAGLGAGWAIDPRTGGTGPQVNAFYTFYYLRGRVLFGDGWELGGGLQIKIPNTWVWHRR